MGIPVDHTLQSVRELVEAAVYTLSMEAQVDLLAEMLRSRVELRQRHEVLSRALAQSKVAKDHSQEAHPAIERAQRDWVPHPG